MHGEDFKLAPRFKNNALRIFMTDKAKGYFDLWEADHDPTNAKRLARVCLTMRGDVSWISQPRRGCNKKETTWMLQLSEGRITITTASIR